MVSFPRFFQSAADTSPKRLWAAFFCVGLIVGLATNWVYGILPRSSNDSQDQDMFFRKKGSYIYINPLLLCGISENKEFDQYDPLQKKISALINQEIEAGKAELVSVYFREVNQGHWFGINQDEPYSPASLLKVARAIAYYKLAEEKPEILSQTFLYDGTFGANGAEYFISPHAIVPGRSYRVDELIRYMIEYSDNNATRILDEHIDQNLLREVYSDMGVQLPATQTTSADFMSAKLYSHFFRVLYNSTYLSEDYSEKVLNLLHDTDFDQGLRQGVPKEIEIAHKFGERTVLFPDRSVQSRELHDCGIVYAPNNPYFLCVMTKGKDFESLKKVIGDVSSSVFSSPRSVVQ